jgi:hypothetical protein
MGPGRDATERAAALGPAPAAGTGRAPDIAASLTIVLVAALGLATAWYLPWWVMKARAPQYGQRTLVIDVGPRNVAGDAVRSYHEVTDIAGNVMRTRLPSTATSCGLIVMRSGASKLL